MNWLNIETKTLHSEAYIGSDPVARATWLSVMLWCAEQENGGRIVGARSWKDRRWQQTCGVTIKEIDASELLMSWEGDDLVVVGYPTRKEQEVRAKRIAGKAGGEKSGIVRGAKSDEAQLQAPDEAQLQDPAKVRLNGKEGEGEEEGEREMEKEVEGEDGSSQLPGFPAGGDSSPIILTFPCNGKVKQWDYRQAVHDQLVGAYPGLNVMAEVKKAWTKVTIGATGKKTASGMLRFLTNWLDRSQNSGRSFQQRPAPRADLSQLPPDCQAALRAAGEMD